MKTKKHAAPLRCRLAVRWRKPDLTAFAICDIGAEVCRKCTGCKHYKPDRLRDSIIESVERLRETVHNIEKKFHNMKLQLSVRLPKENPCIESKEEEI